MLRLPWIIHHIALCTPCNALLLVSHTCVFCDRPRGTRTRGADRASSSQRLHQPSFGSRQTPVHLTNTPGLLFFNLVLCYNWLCIKLIEVV
jgi:hypothetical protein